MIASQCNRRDFHKLSMAAFGGLLAGAAAGCGDSEEDAAADVNHMLEEPHVCRGLNACEGKGEGKDNACAGQGTCATAAKHECKGTNECKGQGGCSETSGRNSCKGKGECAVPLSDEKWTKARKAFEQAMKKAGKEVGEAPAKS